MKTLVSPSILSADFGNLADDIRKVEAAGADWIHVDVMDGSFVPNITIGPVVLNAVRKATEKTLDVHLMIEEPDRYLKDFADAGADILVVHTEACSHLSRTLQVIKGLGKRAGVSFNPATPLDTLTHVMDMVDMIVVMSVNPGFSGQKFIPSVLPKVAAARALADQADHPIDVQVDGGVSPITAGSVKAAGANVLVAGSAVFGAPDYKAAIDGIKNA